MSAAKFDKELGAYVFSGLYKFYVIPTPPNIVSSGYEVKPMSNGDAAAVMADIHFHTLDYRAKAVGEFEDVLKSDPNNATACRGLGYASLLQHDYAKATDFFRRSLAADPNDARAHYYYGLMLSQQKGFADHEALVEITKEATTAISLDPRFADPYNLLAFAQCYSGNPKQGLQTIDKAILLNPRNVNFRLNLARVYMNNQDFDKAIAVLSALQSVQNPKYESEIAQTLDQARQAKSMMQTANASQRALLAQPDQSPSESASSDNSVERTSPEETASSAAPAPSNAGAAKFLKGKITSVDCTVPPTAVLTVVSGAQTWKFKVNDIRHAIVIGADDFSCAWKQQSVAINFRATAANEGYVISVEVQ